MDAIAPVGAMVQTPPPINAVGTLSSLYGLQQQKVGLQQQQQVLAAQTAQAQQQQLSASQQQGVQNFFQTWTPSDHVGADGTIDVDSALQSPQYQSAGNAKPLIMQSLLDLKNKQLTNKQSLAGLNSTLLTQLGTQVGALAKDPDVVADKTDPATGINAGRAKVQQYIDNFSKLSPDAARVAGIYGPAVEGIRPGHLAGAVQALQLQAQDASGQQAQQNPRQEAVPAGANTNIYNVQPSTGMLPGQQPVTRVPYVIPPGVTTGPNNAPITYGPGGAGLQSAGASGGGGGTAPPNPNNSGTWYRPDGSPRTASDDAPPPNAPGGAAVQQQYAKAVLATGKYVGQVRDADENYGTNVSIANAIRRLSANTSTGPGTATWHTVFGAIGSTTGLDNIANYQQLGAWLDRQATGMRGALGLPATNQGQATAESISGTANYQPAAIQAKNDFNQALVEGLHSYRQGLDKVTGLSPTPSPVAVQAFRGAWTNNFDPTVYELKGAQQRMQEDPQALQKVVGNLTPEQAQALRQKRKALQNLTIGQAP